MSKDNSQSDINADPGQHEVQAEAILASGCFWGTEYYLQKLPGVLTTTCGYTGGSTPHPTYAQVCSKLTGHYEAVRVVYDPQLLSYESLLRVFFETHDPTQRDGQGPDIGPQYRSAVFYKNEQQRVVVAELKSQLIELGYDVVTQLLPATEFYAAEHEHQDYYLKTGGVPYCHAPRRLFER